MTELSPEAKELLRRARTAFSPPEARLEAVRSALASQIAAIPTPTPSTSSLASGVATRAVGAAGWATGPTIGAAVLIGALGAGGIAAWALTGRSIHPADPPIAALAQVGPTSETDPSLDENTPLPDTPSELVPTPTWQASPADLAPSPTASTAPRDRTRAPLRARARAETTHETTVEPPAAPPLPTTDSLAEEVSMLRGARAALDRGDAPSAMRLLDAHEARFQHGTLYEERLATRVQTLCALGRVEAARSTAQELERAAPRSPHLTRVRTSCVAQPSK